MSEEKKDKPFYPMADQFPITPVRPKNKELNFRQIDELPPIPNTFELLKQEVKRLRREISAHQKSVRLSDDLISETEAEHDVLRQENKKLKAKVVNLRNALDAENETLLSEQAECDTLKEYMQTSMELLQTVSEYGDNVGWPLAEDCKEMANEIKSALAEGGEG